jgi:hypothetical protein
VGRFGADTHNKLQGCKMIKYLTGYSHEEFHDTSPWLYLLN